MRRLANFGNERGQAAIFVALTLTVSLGLLGLVVDEGWAYWRKEACQTAAQSAATSAVLYAKNAVAGSITCNASGVMCQNATACAAGITSPPANDVQDACLWAAKNGFSASGKQNVTVEAHTGTTATAPGTNTDYYVTVRVSEQIPLTFLSVIARATSTIVSASATGGLFASGTGGCVYVLDPSAHGAWSQSGGNFSTGCGAYVNSNASDAVTMSGGNITLGSGLATSTVKMNIHGQLSKSGGNILPAGNVMQNQGSVSDPMSGLTTPTLGACLPNPNISGGLSNPISPGNYCSGISISGGLGIVLQSGIFVISGSGSSFSVSGGNVTTAAGGATIYFTAGAGNLNVSGGNLTLTAPAAGTTAGIGVWKDGPVVGSTYNYSGGNTTITGIIYMPYTQITYSGGNTAVTQSIVCDTIIMSGGNITQPATSSFFSNGGAVGGAFLVQ